MLEYVNAVHDGKNTKCKLEMYQIASFGIRPEPDFAVHQMRYLAGTGNWIVYCDTFFT